MCWLTNTWSDSAGQWLLDEHNCREPPKHHSCLFCSKQSAVTEGCTKCTAKVLAATQQLEGTLDLSTPMDGDAEDHLCRQIRAVQHRMDAARPADYPGMTAAAAPAAAPPADWAVADWDADDAAETDEAPFA